MLEDNCPVVIKEDTRHVVEIMIGEIRTPEYYLSVVSTLRDLVEEDTVHLFINSYGGCLTGGLELANAVQSTRAHVIAEITGYCYSAATLPFFSASEWRITDHASMLIHPSEYGQEGMAGQLRDAAVFASQELEALCQMYYQTFLTPEEIIKVCEGKQMFLNAGQINARISNLLVETGEIPAPIDEVTENVPIQLDLIGEVDNTTTIFKSGIIPTNDVEQSYNDWYKAEM